MPGIVEIADNTIERDWLEEYKDWEENSSALAKEQYGCRRFLGRR